MQKTERQDKFFADISDIEYHLKHIPMKIRELNQYYQKHRLEFDTEYQRTEVWPAKKKRLLIDSILRKYDISMIFLRQQIVDDRVIYECIDGQQRLRCIFHLLDNDEIRGILHHLLTTLSRPLYDLRLILRIVRFQ